MGRTVEAVQSGVLSAYGGTPGTVWPRRGLSSAEGQRAAAVVASRRRNAEYPIRVSPQGGPIVSSDSISKWRKTTPPPSRKLPGGGAGIAAASSSSSSPSFSAEIRNLFSLDGKMGFDNGESNRGGPARRRWAHSMGRRPCARAVSSCSHRRCRRRDRGRRPGSLQVGTPRPAQITSKCFSPSQIAKRGGITSQSQRGCSPEEAGRGAIRRLVDTRGRPGRNGGGGEDESPSRGGGRRGGSPASRLSADEGRVRWTAAEKVEREKKSIIR